VEIDRAMDCFAQMMMLNHTVSWKLLQQHLFAQSLLYARELIWSHFCPSSLAKVSPDVAWLVATRE
jgi:hypothetical protein